MKRLGYVSALILTFIVIMSGCYEDSIIRGVISNPPAILAGEQTTLKISTYFSGDIKSTLGLYLENGTKIGDMKDDGTNGDDTANDRVYSILVPINESSRDTIIFKIVASYKGKTFSNKLSIPVVIIPKYKSPTEYNDAANKLYSNATIIRSIVTNYNSGNLKYPKNISPFLYDMYKQYEGITQQDSGNEYIDLAKQTDSCVQLANRFAIDPPVSSLASLRQYIISNSQYKMEDLVGDGADINVYKYLQYHSIPLTEGCKGDIHNKAAFMIIKAMFGEATSILTSGLGEIYDLSEISKMAINKGIGVIIGWFVDSKGNGKTLIGKVNNETFNMPVGTYNLFYSSGGNTPMAVNKNVIVSPGQTTSVDFTPGTTVGGYTVSGKVLYNGIGLGGAIVALSGFEVATTTTDLNGAYSFSHIANGSYTITPSKLEITITPASLSVTVNNSDISGLDFGSPPVAQKWIKTFGGSGNDIANAVCQTSDGGFIMAGATASTGAGLDDVYLIKTDSSGNLLWSKTYGGASYDEAYAVRQTTDGGFIIAGYTQSFGAGSADVYLIKTDASGNMLWSKTFGGADIDKANDVQQTSDGGYILAGYTRSFGSGVYDVYLIKTDSNGNLLWSKTYGGAYGDIAEAVQQTSDGGFIVAGVTSSGASGDVYLIKTDSDGNLVWEKTYGGLEGDYASAVQQTSDGGYIIAGTTSSYVPGSYSVYLIKTDSFGNVVWAKPYGETSRLEGYDIRQTLDGGFIIAGYVYGLGAWPGSAEVYLSKTDPAGNKVWTRTYGGPSFDQAKAVQQTSDGGYIISGSTNSLGANGTDVYLIKTDSNGNVE